MHKLWLLLLLLAATGLFAQELKLNPRLDYNSDSQDGQLITGADSSALAKGKVNYIFIFEEGWFNSKRQARRSVSLFEKYKDRVNFVIIDLDRKLSSGQQALIDRYYRHLVPHVVIVDASGNVIYNEPGEVEESRVTGLLDSALRGASHKPWASWINSGINSCEFVWYPIAVTIVVLYVILAISTCALVCVGIAMYLRVRRLAKASESQFRRALEEPPMPHAPQPSGQGAEAETEVAQ